jgi:hypothetical protein
MMSRTARKDKQAAAGLAGSPGNSQVCAKSIRKLSSIVRCHGGAINNLDHPAQTGAGATKGLRRASRATASAIRSPPGGARRAREPATRSDCLRTVLAFVASTRFYTPGT